MKKLSLLFFCFSLSNFSLSFSFADTQDGAPPVLKQITQCKASAENPETGKKETGSIEIYSLESWRGVEFIKYSAKVRFLGKSEVIETSKVDFTTMDKDQVQKDEMASELAKKATINLADLSFVQVFVIEKGSDGAMATLIDFYNKKHKLLGHAGLLGWWPVVCE